ncbi:MAG: LpxL/LpxP family Kdo(2)-lipid IV(A) lauroyl/palmitoleoyl acyltransferase [Pseudomonadales bacterium]
MKHTIFTAEFLQPRYWPTWLVFGVMWLVTRLPHPWQVRFGAMIGRAAFLVARSRRHIAAVNLQLCFPELSRSRQQQLLKQVFRSTGIGLVETAIAWFRDPRDFLDIVEINGLEHLEQAAAEGRGVILLGAHLSTLDFCGAVLGTRFKFDVMYRPNKNRLLETIMTQSREKNFPRAIHRHDIRGVIRSLKAGDVVWYGPDQDYGRKHSVFAPFFGIETATITATARIAKISSSPVIPFTHYRCADGRSYEINLGPPLQNFPTGDDVEDATIINRLMEEAVLPAPEQYWWLHRRFKTRPDGEERPY